jgi:hypothetical protein
LVTIEMHCQSSEKCYTLYCGIAPPGALGLAVRTSNTWPGKVEHESLFAAASSLVAFVKAMPQTLRHG